MLFFYECSSANQVEHNTAYNIDPGKPAAEVSQKQMNYSSKTTCPDRVLPSTLRTSHCTLHSSHSKLHTPHFTLHTSHSTLHTSHFPLLPSHFTLHSSRPTLHTALNVRPTKKTLVPKCRKSANKSISQPSCSHSKTISEIQLQKTIVLPMQPQHEATLTHPFTLRERSYSCKAQWNSIGNSSTSKTCNPFYIEGTILELQITMEFHRQLIHQHHLQSHLHCGNDPTVANHNRILSTAHARKTGETPFTMRNRSEHDPTMIRPHTRPSRTRRTAEVDHRGSETAIVWKNIRFRASLKNAFRARRPPKIQLEDVIYN